jgi:hypothetical protein
MGWCGTVLGLLGVWVVLALVTDDGVPDAPSPTPAVTMSAVATPDAGAVRTELRVTAPSPPQEVQVRELPDGTVETWPGDRPRVRASAPPVRLEPPAAGPTE